jgi:hypothetical protein
VHGPRLGSLEPQETVDDCVCVHDGEWVPLSWIRESTVVAMLQRSASARFDHREAPSPGTAQGTRTHTLPETAGQPIREALAGPGRAPAPRQPNAIPTTYPLEPCSRAEVGLEVAMGRHVAIAPGTL